MSEREDTQVSFRVKESTERDEFVAALEKQRHIPNATVFFRSVLDALKEASDRGELIEWPVELVVKKKK